MLDLKSPQVKRFFRAAAGHLDAAKSLLGACPEKGLSIRGHDVVYLAGYVVECSLKALFLMRYPRKKHQELVEWFKTDLKHNLERLMVELTRKGVNVPKDRYENLKRVRTNWFSEMRYNVRPWGRDEAERVFRAAEQLF